MDRATLDELADSASRCMKACQEAQAEGISTIEMLTRDRNAVAAFSAASQEARWAQAIKACPLLHSSCQRAAWQQQVIVLQTEGMQSSTLTGGKQTSVSDRIAQRPPA